MLDNAKRIAVPMDLLNRSDLKGAKKVFIAVKGKEILLIPESGELEQGAKIFGLRSIDNKGRIVLPKLFSEVSSDWTPYLLDGQIWVTRKIEL